MTEVNETQIKNLFFCRPEIEMERQLRLAQYYKRIEDIPPSEQKRIDELERQLLKIDALLATLTQDEAFVVQMHLVEGVDWARIVKAYNNKWGADMEKSTRALQLCLSKALKKAVSAVNRRIDFDWIDFI